MNAKRSLRAAALAAYCLPAVACLTPMEPSVVPAQGQADEVIQGVKRSLTSAGLEIDSADQDAGIVYTAWKTWGAYGDGELVYRYVATVETEAVRLTAQLQDCPKYSTVFDRCEPYRMKKIPKSIQDELATLGTQMHGSV
ncbi:MAG: hypothetical protein AAF721_29440 [Myxococcota bacterium]